MDKIKFIEEVKIKKELSEIPAEAENKRAVSNPIRASLMKFVHAKLHKNIFKKDFE